MSSMPNNGKVLVIGAGVSGLSSAILLGKAGYKVTIWAKELTKDTTSNTAAAWWYPYLCNPRNKANIWSKTTYEYLVANALHEPEAGTRLVEATEYLNESTAEPWWRSAVSELEHSSPDELPKGYVDGYKITSIVMDTSLYLPWLVEQTKSLGITIKQKYVRSIDEALDSFDIVVNCSGLGARELCQDNSVFPVRGQLLKVKPNGFHTIVADESEGNLAFIVPRSDNLILGGTAQAHDWNLDASEDDTKEILRKIKRIAPDIGKVEIIDTIVGLRPARPEVRLEREEKGGKVIIHNYGHGGAGFTLSWGCAQEVLNLISD